MKFKIIAIRFLSILFLVFLLTAARVVAQEKNRPNILMIVVDDLNDWVGYMNAHPQSKTPNLDRLADRGTIFTNAHAAAPLCGPTRASILSGMRPSTTGIYGHSNYATFLGNPLIDEAELLPKYFERHGYKTLSTGKVFHTGSPRPLFEVVGSESRDFGPRPAERVAYTPPGGSGTATDWGAYPERDEDMPDFQYAQWAVTQLQAEHDRPFFLSVGFVRPHVPWFVPKKWFDMHPLEDIVLPLHSDHQFDDLPPTALRFSEMPSMPKMEWMVHEKRWEASVQAYLASSTFVDHYIGVVLDALEASPYADNTIVVFYSDHGYHLGTKGIWAKHTLWEESTRIPMIIRRPGDAYASRTHKPVNHLDIYPTLLDLAELPPRAGNEGLSLVPLLDNPDAEGFYASITTHGYGNHSVRTERWRYIRYEDGAQELYDHWSDPREWTNLAGNPRYASVIAGLASFLPEHDALWDPGTTSGTDYNDYFREIIERRTRPNSD
jgi:arylsulfatase A-like enzyme